MKKNIIQVAGLIVLVIFVFIVMSRDKILPQESVVETTVGSATSTISTSSSTPKTEVSKSSPQAKILSTTGLSVPDKAWTTFQNYIEYAHTHDIEGVGSLSLKFAGTCSKVKSDPTLKIKCFEILDNIYNVGITLNKSDFSNTYFDNKQIILSTNVKQTDNDDNIKTSKNLIYFIINPDGEMKVIGLELGRSFTTRKSGLAVELLAQKIKDKLKDSDNDQIEDQVENCIIQNKSTCTPTDPFNKDSDEDGYWDSIEPLVN